MEHRRVPPAAWVLSGATGVAEVTLALLRLRSGGESRFFDTGDARLFLLTARDLFGTGHGFAALGFGAQVPYRYGRMGLPLVAWVLALGRPALVGWTLIGVNLAALVAIPGLAATLLDEHLAPPGAAAFVLILPAFAVLFGAVVSDPLVIALLLVACLLEAHSHPRGALAVLAYAVLVKEIAMLALLPLIWRAVRRREWRVARTVTSAVLPYLAWCVWLRWRVGEYPFLARTEARRGAVRPPFVGLWHALMHHTGDTTLVLLCIAAATIVMGVAGAWAARGTRIGDLAAVFTIIAVCIGPEGLRLFGEGLRVLLVPQVFGGLALVAGLQVRRRRTVVV